MSRMDTKLRIDENIFLMPWRTFFKSQHSIDWKEIAELTAGLLDRWGIMMATFDLDEKGIARLKFHSMEGELEKWWEEISGVSFKKLAIKLSTLPPMNDAVKEQKIVFSEDISKFTNPITKKKPKIAPHGAIFAPLMDEEKPFGILVAVSPNLRRDDTLIVSLIAQELSTLIGGSELIRELRKSESLFKKVATKYRDLIDRLEEGIVMVDGDGILLAVNESLRKTLGYSFQDLRQMKLVDIISPEDKPALGNAFARAKKHATSFEIRLRSKNGEMLNAEVVLTYSQEANTYQGIFRVEDYIREGEEELKVRWLERLIDKRARKKKDLEFYLDSFLTSFPGLTFFMTSEGKIVAISPNVRRITGYEKESFLEYPLRWLERVHPEDREKVALAYQRAILSGEGHQALGFKFINKFGRECHFISTAIPFLDGNGRVLGIQGIFQDISSAFKEEAEKVRAERPDSQVFMYLTDLVFVFDLDYHIQLVNPVCESFFGINVTDMLGMPLESLISAEDLPVLRKGVKKAIEEGSVEGLIVRGKRKNGEEIYLEINATPVFEDGEPIAIRGVARNVTERMHFQEREKALQKELAQKEKLAAIGELLGTVSHGIRNPLASIRAIAQNSLHELEPGNPSKTYFRDIMMEADRLERRIKEFLSFYRPFEPDLKPNDINKIITETLNMLAARERKRGIKLELNLDWNIPPLLIDFSHIEQVLLNLIGNAFAAIPDGGILKVSTSRLTDESEQKAQVCIEDNGPGIPTELKDKIFQPFFTTKEHGTGMGLPVSKKIIEIHGGEMKLEKSDLGGAKFVFWLPIMELMDE